MSTKSEMIFADLVPLIGAVGGEVDQATSTDTTLYQELGLDSLSRVDLLALVEKRFSVKIPDAEIVSLATIGDVIDAVIRAGDPVAA